MSYDPYSNRFAQEYYAMFGGPGAVREIRIGQPMGRSDSAMLTILREIANYYGPAMADRVASALRGESTNTEALQQQLKQYAEAFAKLQKQAAPYAVVTAVRKDRAVIVFAGKSLEVEMPKQPVKPGMTVRIVPDTMQILDVVTDVDASGEVATVSRIASATVCEIDRAGSSRAVTYSGALEEGDRVVLDSSATVAVANIGKPPNDCVMSEPTGVTWDDIGGLVEAKRMMREAVESPTKHAAAMAKYGKKPIKGVLLFGAPGCVDGDAEVTINRAGKGFRMTLRDLVERFNTSGSSFRGKRRAEWKHRGVGGRCESCGQKWPCSKQRRRDAAPGGREYTWDKGIPTMIRCLVNGEFRLRQVTAAYPKGVKSVLRMTLVDGKQVRLTADHEVLTPGGVWKRADGLAPGERVITNGLAAEKVISRGRYLDQDGYWWRTSGLKNHPFFATRSCTTYDLPEHRLVAEARENGLSLDEWLLAIANNQIPANAVILRSDQEVHHRDEDSTNNRPDNLVVLSKSEHSKTHRVHLHIPVFLPKETEVASIIPDGEAEVFDITVDEAHNFVANGVVVHNCGKTLLGKAAATAMAEIAGSPEAGAFFYVKGPSLLNMYVGNSEENVRKLFAQARRHKKRTGQAAIIFIDEADAILGKRGDGRGLSSTIVPAFLAEMDGLEDSGALVLLATNRPDTLDPAIVRDGRIDRRIKVTRPGRDDARDIALRLLAHRPLAVSGEEAADALVDAVYCPTLALYHVRKHSSVGAGVAMTLGHIINGAMVAGVVDRATSIAMHRELAGGASGVTVEDIRAGARETYQQSLDIDHTEEIAEFCDGWGHEVASVVRARHGRQVSATAN